jgi:hypothetical protein
VTWSQAINSAWVWSGIAFGIAIGSAMIGLICTAVNRRLTAERDDWQTKASVLVAALAPFAPVKVRTGRVTVKGFSYPVCPSCATGGLILSTWPEEDRTPGRINDHAREHFIEDHLTRENFARAGKAMTHVLGDRWWRR